MICVLIRFYSQQLNKVHGILVQVRPSTAKKYCTDLQKLIREMKKRAEVALQVKETKRVNLQQTFNANQHSIKQNFKVFIIFNKRYSKH